MCYSSRVFATPVTAMETAIGRTPIMNGGGNGGGGHDPSLSLNSYDPSSQLKYADKYLVAEKLQHILREQQHNQAQQQHHQAQQQHHQAQQQPVRYAQSEVNDKRNANDHTNCHNVCAYMRRHLNKNPSMLSLCVFACLVFVVVVV